MLAESEMGIGRQLKWDRPDLFSRNSVAISDNRTVVPLKDERFALPPHWTVGNWTEERVWG